MAHSHLGPADTFTLSLDSMASSHLLVIGVLWWLEIIVGEGTGQPKSYEKLETGT